MPAFDVSHDVIAALLGGLGIVLVAIAPSLYRAAGERRQTRVDLLTLRERMDALERTAHQAHEDRQREHIEILRRIEDLRDG